MRLAFDIDGCLANFNEPYAKLLIEESGQDLFPKGWQDEPDLICPVWNYDKHFGYSELHIQMALDRIRDNPNFWHELRPCFGARAALRHINQLAKLGHDVYFITTRFGVNCKRQTEQWLYDMGIDFPTVIISSNKPPVLKGLGASLFVDDKLSTIESIGDEVDEGGVFLLDRPYNREGRSRYIQIVSSVMDALKAKGLA